MLVLAGNNLTYGITFLSLPAPLFNESFLNSISNLSEPRFIVTGSHGALKALAPNMVVPAKAPVLKIAVEAETKPRGALEWSVTLPGSGKKKKSTDIVLKSYLLQGQVNL